MYSISALTIFSPLARVASMASRFILRQLGNGGFERAAGAVSNRNEVAPVDGGRDHYDGAPHHLVAEEFSHQAVV
jgi:hypothetical protein